MSLFLVRFISISFFVAPFRTVSLRGPVLYPYDEGASPSCDGWTDGTGWTGGRMDGHEKGPLIFFILRYIKHYTHIYTYIQKKSCPDKYLVGLYFGKVGELP